MLGFSESRLGPLLVEFPLRIVLTAVLNVSYLFSSSLLSETIWSTNVVSETQVIAFPFLHLQVLEWANEIRPLPRFVFCSPV
jgi:hypothetical protein